MTSQIESDSLFGTNPPKEISRSPHFIPNSQSDEEIIQDFTVRDSTARSKPSPPTTVILPVQSSSMDPGLPAESRGPGWSMDKFHDGSSSTADQSTHLKPKQLSDSSSSTRHTPQPHILVAPSSGSTSKNSSVTRPKPRPPRLGAASIEQARERLKLGESIDSSTNPTSSSSIDQSIKDPFHPTRVKSKPPDVLTPSEVTSRSLPEQIPAIQQPQATCDRLRLPRSPEITITPNHERSSRHEQAEIQPQSSKKKRKAKTQDNPEPEPPRGSETAKAKVDGDGKRVRKQSAVGKASAKSLQILLNLSQSSDDTGDPNSKPRDPIIIGDSQKTQRRRVYRNGWVLASDPEPEPEPDARNEVSVQNKDQVGGSVHQSPKENLAPPQVPAPKDISSQPFLEIVSSPLSSPTGFSADETASKASKRSKSSVVAKKRVPKKKAAPKPKATKNRKEVIVEPTANVNSNPSPVVLGKRPAADSLPNKTNSTLNLQDIHNPPIELEAPKEADKAGSQSPPRPNTRQSPCRRHATSSNVVLNKSPVTGEPIPVTNKPTSLRKSGPSAADLVQNSAKETKSTTEIKKTADEKKAATKVRKGMSLAEILAITHPKTKKGIRIGLPREEKHRLHININPNPPVQKQVKKKLKVKRGEYDSGEDDARSKHSGSSDSDEPDQQKGSKSTRSKNNDLDDQDIDEEEDVKQNDDLDEEY